MGLDMYIYRVKKPGLDPLKVYDRDKLEGIVIPEEDIENPMCRELLPYCDKVKVTNHYYDFDKMKAETGCVEIRLSSIIGGVTGFTGYMPDGQRIEIQKSEYEIDEHYTVDMVENCYVCSYSEVHYWRKEYDIQEWFYEHLEHVENTGYYLLSEELLIAFDKAFPEDMLPIEPPNELTALCYWEWY